MINLEKIENFFKDVKWLSIPGRKAVHMFHDNFNHEILITFCRQTNGYKENELLVPSKKALVCEQCIIKAISDPYILEEYFIHHPMKIKLKRREIWKKFLKDLG